MQVPLDRWQEKLDLHFRKLADKREGSGLPLFAIEHGLTDDEVEQVGELLRENLSQRKRLGTYWLLWVIYATEIGYHYKGDEYWQSFQEQTRGWESHHRYSLRRWFGKFQQTYHGFEPSGPWAEHFKIIAWPITHAILPRYLQYQFANALYQQRFRLAGLTTLDSVTVGRLLARHTYDVTTRFEKFLQQEELTGRIVLGLLGQVPEGGHEPIYPKTLERIIADLDHVRNTRNWIRDTKRTVVDRFKGIGRTTGAAVRRQRDFGDDEPTQDSLPQPDIRPNLLLRYSGSGKWAVAIDLPNFAPLAAIHADLRAFLKRTRCRISGATDTKPAGWTVSGSRVSILKAWPDPSKPLLAFEQPNIILERLLQSDCRISPGPSWLFRIGADGRARQIRGQNVHPGASYILVSTEEHSAPSTFISQCALECQGVRAVRISVPNSLSAEETSHLKELGLEVARTVRVWPAGLPCRGWDGEGQSKWLTTESPKIGIVHDHPVESYRVTLDDSAEIEINAPDSGGPVFIQLEPLRAGTHHLDVSATRESSSDQGILSGTLELKVREPEPWIPGVPAHTGLVVGLEPHDANLDEFWANKLDLSIGGPESHAVTCFVSLENGAGEQILSEQVDGMFQLPVVPKTWTTKLANVVKREENEWRYLEASSGKLEIRGGELGHYLLRFERDTLPLRWVTRNLNHRLFLRLIDDTDVEDSNADCTYYSMERPIEAASCTTEEVLTGMYPPEPGGLYIVKHGTHTDALTVSSGLAKGEGFQALVVTSNCDGVLSGKITIAGALRVLALWTHARQVGSLADARVSRITAQIHAAIYEKLCGENWVQAEEAFKDKKLASNQVQDAMLRRVGRNRGFKAALRRHSNQFRNDIAQTVNWYDDLARRYAVCTEQEQCEFAVMLTREPHALPDRFGRDLDRISKEAASNSELLRGARFADLVSSAGTEGGENTRVIWRRQWS